MTTKAQPPIVKVTLELVSVDRGKDRVHYKSELIDPPERRHPQAGRVGLYITEAQFDDLGRPVEVWLNIVDAGE
jgi:hypothetical protein